MNSAIHMYNFLVIKSLGNSSLGDNFSFGEIGTEGNRIMIPYCIENLENVR